MKHGLKIRGDGLYCPLPLSIDSYWWCEPDCPHCNFRGLNHIWGKDLRPLNPEALEKKLFNGLRNRNPKTALAHCLVQKKTIRIGSKSDPFQPVERKLKVSTKVLGILNKLRWTYVIQTRFPNNLYHLAESHILRANKFGLITIMPIISPGLEKDWELFERKRTAPISVRIKIIKKWLQLGIPVGVNGEPFIPGFHTIQDFEDTIKMLKGMGIKRYNTYNFHFTPYVAKRIHGIPGVDIERIWEENQDIPWKKTLMRLIDIAKKYGIILGCPDFVNSGMEYRQHANTCCGINVPNPCTFNAHHFKLALQAGLSQKEIIKRCWDNSGDFEKGKEIINGTTKYFYTLKDIK